MTPPPRRFWRDAPKRPPSFAGEELLLLLRLRLIVRDGGADEGLQGALVDLVPLEEVDGAPLVAFEAGVEQLVGIGELRAVVEGELHLALVGVGDRDDAVARPDRAAHPLPFLDDLAVGREDRLADAGEGLAAPVDYARDQLVDLLRWSH